MIWAAALAIGLIAGLSRSLLIVTTGAAIIAPLCVAEILTSGVSLLGAPLVVLGAIGVFNLGVLGGAVTGLLAFRRD